MNQKDLGWLCGIIDGEGNFTVRVHKKQTKMMGLRMRFSPQFTVVNTSREIIDKLERVYRELEIPYTEYTRDRRKANKNASIIWSVLIYSNGLRVLAPLVKRDICKIAELEIIEQFLINGRRKNCSNPYSEEELREKEKLRQKLISLHGNQAIKLCLPFKEECYMSDEKLEKYKKELNQKRDEKRKENQMKSTKNNPKCNGEGQGD